MRMRPLLMGICALSSVACLIGMARTSRAVTYKDSSLANGEPGIVITGWSPITCTVTPWKNPGFPKAIHFDCVATISGHIANASSREHYRMKAWFMDMSDKKGHLPLGFQPSDINGDALPTFAGNGDVSVRVEASGGDDEGDCPAGEYSVNTVHIEAAFDLASGARESYVDNKEGRVIIVCSG